MSFENKIITEKYIIKLREVSNYCNSTFIQNRFKLVVKYMVGNNLFDNIPLCNSYFSQIDKNIQNDIPFIIKTDLYTELTYLDNINQGGLLKIIKDLQKEYQKELTDEITMRKTLDEGQLYERNQQMIDDFKREYGFDPIENQTFINHNADEDDEDEEDNTKKFKEVKNTVNDIDTKQSKQTSQETTENIDIQQNEIKKETININTYNGNCSLESLNQILDIVDINYDEIIKDKIILKEEEKPVVKKKRMTKKEKEALTQALGTQSLGNVSNLEIENLVTKFSKLKIQEKKNESNNITREGIDAAIIIAKYYHSGEVLQKSFIKGNMIYVYLIKKFNDSEAMYLLGEELLNGITIQKNHKQATKLIKIAADNYKHTKAITKLKTLIKQQ
jgi:hypothetical protein